MTPKFVLPDPKLVPLPKEIVDPEGSADRLGLEAPDANMEGCFSLAAFPKANPEDPDEKLDGPVVANGDCELLLRLAKPDCAPAWFPRFKNGEFGAALPPNTPLPLGELCGCCCWGVPQIEPLFAPMPPVCPKVLEPKAGCLNGVLPPPDAAVLPHGDCFCPRDDEPPKAGVLA